MMTFVCYLHRSTWCWCLADLGAGRIFQLFFDPSYTSPPNAQSRMSRNRLLKDTCLVLSAPFLLNRLFFHSIGPCDSQSHTLILTVKQVLVVPKQQAASTWISMVMEFSVTPVFLFVLSHTLPQLYWICVKLLL